ncbi:MAG TPA: hypothetical protein VKA49_14660 [Flavitalea sp.]|nr:hypothetical protein [Flavitalea sp.]
MASGYSGTPLIKKLGILDTSKILLINAPEDYFDLLEKDVKKLLAKKGDAIDLVHLFVTSNKMFESEMRKLSPLYKTNPSMVIWVSWYKKAAGIPTDITEDTIRNFALANHLVDVKVCAVSEIWSGLKLVVPRSKR